MIGRTAQFVDPVQLAWPCEAARWAASWMTATVTRRTMARRRQSGGGTPPTSASRRHAATATKRCQMRTATRSTTRSME
eukprot:1942191-Prymnesium_polylepis.1